MVNGVASIYKRGNQLYLKASIGRVKKKKMKVNPFQIRHFHLLLDCNIIQAIVQKC